MGRKSRLKREGESPRKPTPPVHQKADDSLIPREVNSRILSRILLFSGLPFAIALLILPIAAYLIKQGAPLPNVAVLLVNLLFFGLSVVGVTYGLLSASWDPERRGSFWGVGEFKLNGQRLWGALTSEGERQRQEKKSS